MSISSAPVDIVKAEIARNALLSAAREMNDTLIRSAYNPLIFDVRDFGVGITGPTGDLWADAPGLPIFTGLLPSSVRSGIAKHGLENIAEGDVFIVNSPYLNGSHISDTAIYMPVFHSGRIIAFTGSMAHWADVSGMSPGGWTVNSTEIYQEGISFTHQRLFRAGEVNQDMFDLLEENMRVSNIVLGDVRAQIATARTGAERIIALCDRYGADEVEKCMTYVLEQTEKSLRAEIAALPDGIYRAGFTLDTSGVDPDEVPHVEFQANVTGDRVLITFDGTSKTSSGPINCGAEATAAAVAETFKGILDPRGPANQAHLNVAEIAWPDQPTLINPVKPAPCDSYGYVINSLIETIQQAFGTAAPDRVRAGGYQMVATYIMATHADAPIQYLFCEPVQGGHGAFPGKDGGCMAFVGDGDVSNTPVEVLEQRFPITCQRFELEPEAGGSGQWRGGSGVVREFWVQSEASMIKTAQENSKDTTSRGVAGGGDGRATYVELHYPDGQVERCDERLGDTPVPVGLLISTHTGGGGGYGKPVDRDPQKVAEDVRDGYLTLEEAKSVYKVALSQGALPECWEVDTGATSRLRAA